MDTINAIILGLVQGFTELLPISSSAHLGLISKLFNWQEESITFDILLHAASLMAIIIFFRGDIKKILVDLSEKDGVRRVGSIKFIRNILLSLLPLIPFYLIFNELIVSFQTFSNFSLFLLVFFGILLIISERVGKGNVKSMDDITIKNALIIGFFQCLSLMSGVSRSGIIITAGLFLGLKEDDSKRYAFLLAIPTILGAFLIEMKGIISNEIILNVTPAVLFGLLASFISALFALHILFTLGEKIKLSYYGIYRILLGIILLIILNM